MEWIREKNISFKLVNLEIREDFAIWKSWDKRSETLKDSAGNEMIFPIKKGQLVGSDGSIKEVADLKYMKKVEFFKLYPNLAKNTKYIRCILVNGQECNYAFTNSSNFKLANLIDTLRNTGINPLEVNFVQTFDKNLSPANMYNITVAKITDKVESNILLQSEKDIVEAIKSKFEEKVGETRFVEIMKSNNITEIRAKEIYKLFY